MTHHKNITYKPTAYPAPTSCYRNGPNGEMPFYTASSVKHAEKLHSLGKKARDVEVTLTTPREWNSLGSKSPALALRTCRICKDTFMPNNPRQVMCTNPECKKQNTRNLQRIKDAKRATPIPERTCDECGNTYLPTRFTQKSCSEACRDVREKRQRVERNRAFRERQKEQVA